MQFLVILTGQEEPTIVPRPPLLYWTPLVRHVSEIAAAIFVQFVSCSGLRECELI